MTVLSFSAQLALGIALPAYLVRRDLSRLPPDQLARSWNDASFWSAIVTFGPLCIPVHFIKTRRTVGGAVLGVAWMVAAMVVLSAVDAALTTIDK